MAWFGVIYPTGFGVLGKPRYYDYNLEKQLEYFIKNNPNFIKSEIEKCEIIHRLQHVTYTRITSLR